MSLKLKSQLVKLGLGLFHLLRYLWRSGRFCFIYLLVRPLGWLGQGFLGQILVPVYRIYHRVKQRQQSVLIRYRHTWLSLLTARSLIHVAVIVLAFTVASNSVLANDNAVEDFGSRTLLKYLIQGGEAGGEEFVEYALPAASESLYAKTHAGTVNRGQTFLAESDERTLLALARQERSGVALARANIPTTDFAGAPRQKVVEYAVEGGDTVSLIASRFNVSADSVIWANGLDERAMIKPGQTIKVPPVSGVIHTVAKGETVESIAKKYQADSASILDFNRLADAAAIEAGSQLVVPGGKIEKPKPVVAPTSGSRLAAYSGPKPASVRASGTGLLWPTTSRRINQGYSLRHPGIDIDGSRSPLYAAESGRVVRTNWGGGYGNDVIIDHGNGLQTLYAHLSKAYVAVGQAVGQGEVIGISGCTGRCTGDHLHFEVWINGRRTNPFNYL